MAIQGTHALLGVVTNPAPASVVEGGDACLASPPEAMVTEVDEARSLSTKGGEEDGGVVEEPRAGKRSADPAYDPSRRGKLTIRSVVVWKKATLPHTSGRGGKASNPPRGGEETRRRRRISSSSDSSWASDTNETPGGVIKVISSDEVEIVEAAEDPSGGEYRAPQPETARKAESVGRLQCDNGRTRGRPPTHGHTVGLGQARKEDHEGRAQMAGLQTGSGPGEPTGAAKPRTTRTSMKATGVVGEQPPTEEEAAAEDRSTTGLARQARVHLNQVRRVANRSKNLKGNLKKYLRDSAAAMKDIVEALVDRTSSEEVRTLERTNRRLMEEMRSLREEMRELKEQRGSPNNRATPTGPTATDRARTCSAEDIEDVALARRLEGVHMEVDCEPPPPPSAPDEPSQDRQPVRPNRRARVTLTV